MHFCRLFLTNEMETEEVISQTKARLAVSLSFQESEILQGIKKTSK